MRLFRKGDNGWIWLIFLQESCWFGLYLPESAASLSDTEGSEATNLPGSKLIWWSPLLPHSSYWSPNTVLRILRTLTLQELHLRLSVEFHFLETGIIIKRHANIEGLTDAATIWCSAAIGMAAGAGLYWLAILASILLVIGTNVLHLLEKNHRDRQDSYMITCDSIDALNQLIQENQSSMSWHRVEKHGKKEYLIRLQMDFENKDVREKWETEIFSNPSVSSFRFLYPTDWYCYYSQFLIHTDDLVICAAFSYEKESINLIAILELLKWAASSEAFDRNRPFLLPDHSSRYVLIKSFYVWWIGFIIDQIIQFIYD